MLREYLGSVGSKAVPLLERLEEYYVVGTYTKHIHIQMIVLLFPNILTLQHLSRFIDAFYEGKNNKEPRYPPASWSVLERVMAGKISYFLTGFYF